MYLWRKIAERRWLGAREDILQVRSGGALAIISRPARKRLQLEIACTSRKHSGKLVKEFGGRVAALPRNWLERFTLDDSKPIKIGRRLIVVGATTSPCCSVRCPQRMGLDATEGTPLRTADATARKNKTRFLVIPASTAFGTGEHVTTAMSLRLLEELTRHWKHGWSVVDLGTGSGLLALAASRFGAGRVLGLDIDPTAISMAKSNANLNKIRGVTFQFADVRKWKSPRETHIITANLYSDLLMEILPKLRRSGWLILSGILRGQEIEFVGALRRNKLTIISIRRRGKWIAVLASQLAL